MAIESQGLAIVFGTSAWTAELTSVNQNDVSRESLDVTHLGSTTSKDFIDLQYRYTMLRRHPKTEFQVFRYCHVHHCWVGKV